MNEYLHGPIWVYDEEGFIRRKYPLIDNDDELRQLNEQARNLYDSFYSFNENDSTCVFDEDGYKAAYEEMIGIIKKKGLHFFLGDGFFARGIDRNLIRVKK